MVIKIHFFFVAKVLSVGVRVSLWVFWLIFYIIIMDRVLSTYAQTLFIFDILNIYGVYGYKEWEFVFFLAHLIFLFFCCFIVIYSNFFFWFVDGAYSCCCCCGSICCCCCCFTIRMMMMIVMIMMNI